MKITIPFARREYQKPLVDAIDSGEYKRAFALWHRRAGKDVCLWNLIVKRASQKIGVYYYFLPTYAQGKKILWDGITNEGIKFLDFIPKEIIKSKNGQEMKIELINGSIIQIVGTDHYDSIRGTNPMGCVFSEYAFQNPMAWEIVKPILKVNKGWAVFNTTPNGKNHAYDLYNTALEEEDWFCEKLTIADTAVLEEEDMDKERKEGMSEEMVQQEYYCSFDVGALGAYYAEQINKSRSDNRICEVPYDPVKKVSLYLDLGKNDSTVILFLQFFGKEIRIIDCLDSTGKEVDWYAKQLKEKPYEYDKMFLPHDAKHKRLENKLTIEQQFEEHGFDTEIVISVSIIDGINAVRKLFPNIWIHKGCTQFLRAIENYHKEYDPVAKIFRDIPKHDWSSHFADALRYFAISYEEEKVEYVRSRKRVRKPRNMAAALFR